MQYWIAINDQKYGPLELDQLLNMNISPDVFVWREGLTTWTKAKDLSELSAILKPHVVVTPPPLSIEVPSEAEQASSPTEQASVVDVADVQTPAMAEPQPISPPGFKPIVAPGSPVSMPYEECNEPPLKPVMPDNYLVWSIITMICCCQPFGIVALVYSLQVSSLYNQGNYAAAEKASGNAKMWVIVSIAAGLVLLPFIILFNMGYIFAESGL